MRPASTDMLNHLAPFQAIKSSCDRIAIAVEDVSNLWSVTKDEFEEHLPFKRACLNNRTHNAVVVENLSAEFILTTDLRLRSRSSFEQSFFCFREPYATVILVTCEDQDEFRTIVKPRLKLIVGNDDREWFIVFVSRAQPSNESDVKLAKRLYAKFEVDFNSKRRDRCCKFDIHAPKTSFWEDFEFKIIECIRNTLDRRLQFYEDEIRKLSELRLMPVWNFCNFFILKESLAFVFEMSFLYEDALREYDELELCYLETISMSTKHKNIGVEYGDDQAALMNSGKKPLTRIVADDTFKEFDFKQYLFGCQSKLLLKLKRPFEVACRGSSFIRSFSKLLMLHENELPFCLREVWVITACSALINAICPYNELVPLPPGGEKEFYCILGDLYSLCRMKFLQLAYLLGYGTYIQRSPINSALLSMLPWPRPAVWPSVPSNASSEVLAKEMSILQDIPKAKNFDAQRKPVPLESTVLSCEANPRRAPMPVGNMGELLDDHLSVIDRSLNGCSLRSSFQTVDTISIQCSDSSPGNVDGSIDQPMRLAEIFVSSEHALKHTVSDAGILKSLSSVDEFENKYLELSKVGAYNYHRSWWKRHGVIYDGEIAAICFKHENFDLAAKLYENVCALYVAEGWQDLLVDVLPNLSKCQKMLSDHAGYLLSCVKLLSLDKCLFLTNERQAFQAELIYLAYMEMKDPLPLNVSSLITFSGNPGLNLLLCDGDPHVFSVTVWSGFPKDITFDSLYITLTSLFNNEIGAKALRKHTVTVLKPGWNTVHLDLPPQKSGSYTLGVLTGQIGYLRFRSHNISSGGPAYGDDFVSYEKPTRSILKVSERRPVIDLSAAASSPLLLNETQWVGVTVRPIKYSLKGAILHIDTGPGLNIEESLPIEIEICRPVLQNANIASTNMCLPLGGNKEIDRLSLEDSGIVFPDWATDVNSVVWIPIRAVTDGLPQASLAVSPPKQSTVDGMRTMALKLEFGVSHNQIFESNFAIHFNDPFIVTIHVIDEINDDTLLLQVMLHSQLKATLTIFDAWLESQDDFDHVGQGNGRPVMGLFPLVICPMFKTGIYFSVHSKKMLNHETKEALKLQYIMDIRYEIVGDRTVGAHPPVCKESIGTDIDRQELIFKSCLSWKRSVLYPWLAVGFLPLLASGITVGQLFSMEWKMERLESKVFRDNFHSGVNGEILFEVRACSENWMIAGRKRGLVLLSPEQGSIVVVSVLCVPLVVGFVQPPQLKLPNIDESYISLSPPGPRLVCVRPPNLSVSLCIAT